jgi:hypothetical protein
MSPAAPAAPTCSVGRRAPGGGEQRGHPLAHECEVGLRAVGDVDRLGLVRQHLGGEVADSEGDAARAEVGDEHDAA